LARSEASLNVVVMIDSTAGASSAAPRPCATRPATSIPGELASPLTADAAVNSATPARNRRLRPNRSPARPPSSKKPPNASVYAVITHCRSAWAKPRSLWIAGRATFTIVASSTTMNCAKQTRTSTSHLLVSRVVI
jgi:hypothetical protein